MIYLTLFYEFFKTGLFAVGGGYASIPFLYHLMNIYNWFGEDELINMLAVSNLTPGPIGINMATYTGYSIKGILGSLCSTLGIIFAPFIITLFVIYLINKFKNTNTLKYIFEGLRPVSCALLGFIFLKLIKTNIVDLKSILILIVLSLIYPKLKKAPSLIIIAGGLLGFILYSF